MPKLSDILDLNAPAKIGAQFTPSAIDERALGAEQVQASRDQITRGRRLRELTSSGASDMPQRLAQEGFVNEAGQYQALADSAENRAAKKKQGAETARRNKFLELSARGINGDVRDQDITMVLGEMGLPPEQVSAYVQDAAQRRAAGQNLQEFFYSLGDPEGYAEVMKKSGTKKTGKSAASELEIGKFNPGDYTPNSFTKFLQTKNPADLVRYTSPAYSPDLAAQIAAARSGGMAAGKDAALMPGREEAVGSFREARKLLDDGIYAGKFANVKTNLEKIGGVAGMDTTKAARTEEFKALLATTVLPRMAELGGNDTEEERRYLSAMMGGDIELEPAAIKKIIDSAERKILRRLERSQEIAPRPFPPAAKLPALPAAAQKPPAKQPASGGVVSLDQYLKSKGF